MYQTITVDPYKCIPSACTQTTIHNYFQLLIAITFFNNLNILSNLNMFDIVCYKAVSRLAQVYCIVQVFSNEHQISTWTESELVTDKKTSSNLPETN